MPEKVVCEDCAKPDCEIRGKNHPMPCIDFVKKTTTCPDCGEELEEMGDGITSFYFCETCKQVVSKKGEVYKRCIQCLRG